MLAVHRPNDDAFRRLALPALDGYSGRELAALLGVNRRTIDPIRRGQTPHLSLRSAMTRLAQELPLAVRHTCTTVERSTFHRSAASRCVACPVTTDRYSSYFSLADNRRRARPGRLGSDCIPINLLDR